MRWQARQPTQPALEPSTSVATRCWSRPPSSSPSEASPRPGSPMSHKRVGASPALVIYYFGTKDDLLTEALRYSESKFYVRVHEMLEHHPGATRPAGEAGPADVRSGWGRRDPGRVGTVVRPVGAGISTPAGREGPCGTREALAIHDRWRRQGRHAGGRDRAGRCRGLRRHLGCPARRALHPGRAQDHVVDPERAFDIAMTFAEQALALPPARRPAKNATRRTSNRKAARRA